MGFSGAEQQIIIETGESVGYWWIPILAASITALGGVIAVIVGTKHKVKSKKEE